MPKYRVTMAFDLVIKDEERASGVAAEFMRQLAQQELANGGKVVSSIPGSPEVAAFQMAQSELATASTVAMQLLVWGVGGNGSWVDAEHIKIQSDRID